MSTSAYSSVSPLPACAMVSPLASVTSERPEKTICPSVPVRLHMATAALFWNDCTFTSQSNISAGSSSLLAVGMRMRSAPSRASVRMLSG